MTGLCQGGSRLVQILERPQPCLISRDRLAEQIVQEHLQHFQHLVLCGGFQTMDEGHERRDPGRRWHAADGLSLGAVGEGAKDAIRLGGMRTFIGMVIPSARTAFNQSIAARIGGPLMRVGPERIWSSKETRPPSGTSSSRCNWSFCWQGDPPRQQLMKWRLSAHLLSNTVSLGFRE
jgi:hypothetical protein